MIYTVVFKRYAPFSSFGGGYHGDGRITPSLLRTARTWGFVTFGLSEGVISSSTMSSPTFKVDEPSKRKTGIPRIKVKTTRKTDTQLEFSAHTAGANPMVSLSPDIDTFLDIRITETEIHGCLRGDDFPSAEVYLQVGASGVGSLICSKSQLLYHFQTPYGGIKGPFTRLFGTHQGQWIGAFNKRIEI